EPGEASSSRGSAARPSITGISMSRMMTSASLRAAWTMAIWPLLQEAMTSMRGSADSMRVMRPRTMAESSTTITRTGSFSPAVPMSGPYRQFKLDELVEQHFAVIGLHDVFVGTGFQRLANFADAVFGGAHHHRRTRGQIHAAQRLQAGEPVHFRHVPVQQDEIRHRDAA